MSEAPWNPTTTRNLCDKMYDKRKQGALDVEQIVRQLNNETDKQKIFEMVEYIIDNFSTSANGNHRKGGLIALAAVGIGLGPDIYKLLHKVVPPIIKCFSDQDSRVRYYACESMYNVTKVARSRVLPFFNDIFDGLCKLSADPDPHVKNGALLLDRLIKDIVTESEAFNVDKFIPLMKERIYVVNALVRQFLLGWIQVLNSVPDIDLIKDLPEILDGIFVMLSDKKKEIRRQADNVLSEFLREVKTADDVAYGSLVKILIPHCSASDDMTRLSAVTWVGDFISVGERRLLPYADALVGGILPSLAHDVAEIRHAAFEANNALLKLIDAAESEEFPIESFLKIVSVQFKSDYVDSRIAALSWVSLLHAKGARQQEEFLDDIFPALLQLLSDPSEKVVTLSLEVMARIAANEEYFKKLMNSLIVLFNNDLKLLEKRASLALRQLSLFIDPEKIFRALAEIVEKGTYEPDFAAVMIQTLNIILLTSTEFSDMRKSLRDLREPTQVDLFITLYKSWCHNPTATFSLCLMARAYEHAYALVRRFAELEISVSLLVEIDKLVQLIESPIFTSLRMHLLEPECHPFLFKALYGLLMLLPQSSAFTMLKTRLESVTTIGILQLLPKSRQGGAPEAVTPSPSPAVEEACPGLLTINFEELIAHFDAVQENAAVPSMSNAHTSPAAASRR